MLDLLFHTFPALSSALACVELWQGERAGTLITSFTVIFFLPAEKVIRLRGGCITSTDIGAGQFCRQVSSLSAVRTFGRFHVVDHGADEACRTHRSPSSCGSVRGTEKRGASNGGQRHVHGGGEKRWPCGPKSWEDILLVEQSGPSPPNARGRGGCRIGRFDCVSSRRQACARRGSLSWFSPDGQVGGLSERFLGHAVAKVACSGVGRNVVFGEWAHFRAGLGACGRQAKGPCLCGHP